MRTKALKIKQKPEDAMIENDEVRGSFVKAMDNFIRTTLLTGNKMSY